MAVSQPRHPSSIDLSGLPPRVVEAVVQMTAVCHQLGSERSPGAFEETERRVRESVHALGCEILGACAESRDDGAPRIERDGQSWFRVALTPKTIMSSLGPVAYRRARYRTGACSTSLMPADKSLGLVNDWPAAQLGLMMMGHCTAQEAEEFFEKVGGMTPPVGEHLAAAHHEHAGALGTPRPGGPGRHRGSREHPAGRGHRLGLARRGHGGAEGRRGRPRRSLLARSGLRYGLLPRRPG